ncbi:MAG: hypothetical protein M3Q89_08155 [Verrucomicrobiota bacterium]|nr:hypothetical protein [Verrucomicrobiota bacterium]
MALSHASAGEPAAALEAFNKAESGAAASANHDPKNARVRIQLARIWTEMAALYRKLAGRADPPTGSRNVNLNTAMDLYQRSLLIWQDSRANETLSRTDESKPEEIAKAVAEIDADLR